MPHLTLTDYSSTLSGPERHAFLPFPIRCRRREYLFFASTGIDIAHLLSFLLIGFVVAFVARRNEMMASIALALIYAAMAIFGSVYVAVKTADGSLLWRLNWYFADSFAIVIAGTIVRTHRLRATSRRTKPS